MPGFGRGLVTNDPASGVFGQFDPQRMQQITAEFIDPNIQMD